MDRTGPLQVLKFKPTLGGHTYAARRVGQLAGSVSWARLLWCGQAYVTQAVTNLEKSLGCDVEWQFC